MLYKKRQIKKEFMVVYYLPHYLAGAERLRFLLLLMSLETFIPLRSLRLLLSYKKCYMPFNLIQISSYGRF